MDFFPSPILYVDTSSLRTFGGAPLTIGDAMKPVTGALAVLELVSAALSSPEEHDRVRPACRHLVDGVIEVDWRFPEEIVLSAFAVVGFQLNFEEQRREPLKELLVAATKSHEELRATQLVAERGLSPNFFVDLDQHLSSAWPNLAKASHAKAREHLSALPREEADALRRYSTGQDAIDLSRNVTREVLFERVSEVIASHQPSSPVSLAQLRQVYVGDLETFVSAWSWASSDLFFRGAEPRRNDGIDLMHFYYFDRAVVLGSHDNRMLKIAEAIDLRAVRPTR